MKTRFKIKSDEYKGPFDLDLTNSSGQTSQPAWKKNSKYFEELICVDNKPCLIKIAHKSNSDKPIDIIAEFPEKIDKKLIKSEIMDIFGLNDDLTSLYNFLKKESQA